MATKPSKPSKPSKSERNSERRAVLEQLRRRQAASDRRRNGVIVGVCSVIALGIVAAAAYGPIRSKIQQGRYDGKDVAQIGAAAGACQAPVTKRANGNQTHVAEGTDIDYPDAPPAFGEHYLSPDPMGRKFYSAQDRPALGTLVHNEEHGYTILWYDDTVAHDTDQMAQIRAIASRFAGTSNLRLKFKAVPWLPDDEDGKTFPAGQHVALTHWSQGGSGDTTVADQVGVWQYCSAPSGAALSSFMLTYPYTDSPEPVGA